MHECISARARERRRRLPPGSERERAAKAARKQATASNKQQAAQREQQASKQAAAGNKKQVAQREQQASSKQRRATSSEGEAVRPSLDCLNGEDLVLSTGKEVFLVLDHSLNVLHGVVGLNLEGRGLTVAVLGKICIPLRGWSVE